MVIGKVSATEKSPSTVDDFYFWTDRLQVLSPFDIVKVKHVKGQSNEDTVTFGVVEEICHITDAPNHITSYISSDFGSTDESVGNMYRLGMNYVKAKVVHNTGNIYTPVLDGKQVETCEKEDVKIALGLQNMKNPLICGYLQMYQKPNQIEIPVEINSHFLIGPEGAHLNISGISGLAAKTSYSMFLIKAIQEKYLKRDFEKIEYKNQSVAFIFFNVKGRDLLAINEPNTLLSDNDKELYKTMNLSPDPFENVKYYYPFSKDKNNCFVQSFGDNKDIHSQIDRNEAYRYKYVLENDKDRDKLDLLFANEDDNTGTIDSIITYIINKQDGFNNISTWKELKDAVDAKMSGSSGGTTINRGEIMVSSWRKFKRILNKALDSDIFVSNFKEDNNEVRLSDAVKCIKKNEVMVVDVARLDEDTQSFVFGDVARAVYELKLGREREDIPSKIVIFVDELNKYASTDIPKNSPILRQLLDIAERGRSLGIILFSAEQFKSAIHDRVKGNCSTHAYGRTNAIEISKPDYRYIPKVYQNMMTRLTQGEYIIQNPVFRSMIHIKFPNPTYKQFPNG